MPPTVNGEIHRFYAIEYQRVSRIRRLRKLLQALVSVPGDPIKMMRGAFIPKFQGGVRPDLMTGLD
jgi:hypothetical protein